ncbi:TcaA NTF2-like domain-containing protein [Macrococcoides caseolyticum]|uniref:TcaA NTF2-like domain-containing protein n=1 Tax=Macrococcoides caseolyticum TaxID=69966 RepID=UPI001F1AE48C|nr:hypothetical protein [Macrococcus caseolyticus]MCE4957785.1 hypothetical protein [Macrococcus caseolyticus]
MRIYTLFLALLLTLTLTACNSDSEKTTEETKVSNTSKVKSDANEKTTDKEQAKSANQKKKTTELKKTTVKKSTSEAKANLKQLTMQTMNAYLKAMPSAFNQRNYSKIKPYIKADSKAEEYILAQLPTGNFDNYRIDSYKVDRVEVKGSYAHAIVTRVMSSNATGGQSKRVITVFDFFYNKKSKKMELYDFNDKAIFDENKATTPSKAQVPVQAKGDATTCIQTRLASSCEGISDATLLNTYNEMVRSGALPQAEYNGCITCTIKAAYQLKDNKVPTAAVNSLAQAVQMTTDQYLKKVEAYYPEKDIAMVGAEPINGSDIQEDSGGKYYKVKAVDIKSKELLQTYKVYIENAMIVAE